MGSPTLLPPGLRRGNKAARALRPADETVAPRNFPSDVEPGLAAAYEHCRAVNRHYGKTYYFSTCFFPASLRPAVHALYAWVRYPDEWVDNPGGLTIPEQRDKLRQWRDATADAVKTGRSEHPVLSAWADAARRHGVPVQYMRDFMDAMEMDLTVSRYETFEDLTRYTWGSASVVGLMMCHLIGATDPKAVRHAADLGTAMQLTNFLRDVGEDWRERGRIYLPLEDLRRFDVREGDIAEGRLTEGFCELVRWQAERTRALYDSADQGFCYIPADARLPVRLARILYARILDKIEQNGCDVFTRRARVPTWEKLVLLAREQRAVAAGRT
uniref:Phytoene synthase n=1 Tax=uncultured Armatimonadetes bacterium TaxID=157466 RepID=A0A6J4IV70_9BACT|nr:Phytoene synthase [uncultured Armatimonadetes bacterium]